MAAKVKISGVEDEVPVPSNMKVPLCITGCEARIRPAQAGNSNHLKFVRENIFQTNFQFYQDGFQFVQSQMMLAMLNAKKRLIGDANLPGKLCIRKTAPFLTEEFCQLPVQVALHIGKVAKRLSRMRDAFPLQIMNEAVK
jgi:hypothetical protein